MGKQKYEQKQIISICGTLNKEDDGKYIVTVEERDNVREYSLNDILDSMDGNIISLTSEMF